MLKKIPAIIEFIATLSGALAVSGFAPYHFWLAPILSLTVLFLLWQRAGNARGAAEIGFLWGMGFFISGISWIDISLHDFGGMPLPLSILCIVLFGALLASFPGLVGYFVFKFHHISPVRWLLITPALWTLSEWFRSFVLTGFPWLSLGYSQTTYLIVFIAGLMLLLTQSRTPSRSTLLYLGVLITVLSSGIGLRKITWTHPVGEVVSVSLLQGNFAQDKKFDDNMVQLALERYLTMINNSQSQLIILPESAFPVFRQELPEYVIDDITNFGRTQNADILVGMFSEPEPHQYYNSVFSFGHSPSQIYQKVHLVPFGEFIPLSALLKPLINSVLKIPLDNQQSGSLPQPPMRVSGQKVAVNICYEDVFGDQIVQSLPAATLLANVTNDAWFGNSIGPEQHLQMAQTRSLETGRPMLRATNTGVSAIIDPLGRIINRAPREQVFVLNGEIRGYQGNTPFDIWGNSGIVSLCTLILIFAKYRRRTK
ncbi:MAG: apolipoprotein N-acyltransferase [Ferrovum sp. 37-45-19]|nr:MAG: apolipoprotein N-acyltransferase [Ferrovum sp. 37-45-19]